MGPTHAARISWRTSTVIGPSHLGRGLGNSSALWGTNLESEECQLERVVESDYWSTIVLPFTILMMSALSQGLWKTGSIHLTASLVILYLVLVPRRKREKKRSWEHKGLHLLPIFRIPLPSLFSLLKWVKDRFLPTAFDWIYPYFFAIQFLLAVWKNASTNVNHGIFVQLFRHLLDIYCIFMLSDLCLGSWSQLVPTMSNQHANVRRWSKSCTKCEIEMILKRGLRQDEWRRANSTDWN